MIANRITIDEVRAENGCLRLMKNLVWEYDALPHALIAGGTGGGKTYVSLLTVFENLEALYICRNVITVYPDCKSMIDVARQKLMNDPTFKHLSEDCQEYYFDFEAYASHLQEHGKFLVTEHGIFELPE